ncbi:MAG: CRTAC1 family protein [Hyphomicrobiales bacterium]|nr:CRTAC1 family protein [Hyphomicrobiales bacterium]
MWLRPLAAFALVAVVVWLPEVAAQPPPGIAFTDRSSLLSGHDGRFEYHGSTHGNAWGDLNDDGLPDLYANHHVNDESTIWLNDKAERFRVQAIENRFDKHGAAWADFDNDFDQDIVELVGGAAGNATRISPRIVNRLLVNKDGTLVDKAEKYRVQYAQSRGRSPAWFDADGDGRLDFFHGAAPRSDATFGSTILRRVGKTFVDDPTLVKNTDGGLAAAIPVDIDQDGDVDLVAVHDSRDGAYILTQEDGTYTATPVELAGKPADVHVADFDNDGYFDVVGGTGDASIAWRKVDYDTVRLVASVGGDTADFVFEFKASGKVDFDLSYFRARDFSDIHIGSTGWHPEVSVFSLDTSDERAWGKPAEIFPGTTIWYDSAAKQWTLQERKAPDRYAVQFYTIHAVRGVEPLTEPVRWTNHAPRIALLGGTASGLSPVDHLPDSAHMSVASIAVGDFDNDMDLDLFVLGADWVGNRPSMVFENDGSGHFTVTERPNLHPGIDYTVSTADYDIDGFLDLMIGSGGGPGQFVTGETGGYQLLRNDGNQNNWVAVDLQGVGSNFDAIGATVKVTTGGVTQMRAQTNGMHVKTQDHSRLHFGLAGNDTVDEIRVRWPDGREQVHTDIPANQIVEIVERTDTFAAGAPPPAGNPGLHFWQETKSDRFHLDFTDAPAGSYVIRAMATDGQPLMLGRSKLPEGLAAAWTAESAFEVSGALVEKTTGGLRFRSPSGSDILLSIEIDGGANPRQVRFGPEGLFLSTSGWLLKPAEIGRRSNRFAPIHAGMNAGRIGSKTHLIFDFTGNAPGSPATRYEVDIWTSVRTFFPRKAIKLFGEAKANATSMTASFVVAGDDPRRFFAIGPRPATLVGVRLTKDGVVQRRQNVVGLEGSLGRQNTYFIENQYKPKSRKR